MRWETIRLETDARGVARLTLDRPAKHNALSGEACDELTEAAEAITADAGIRVVVLTGAGASFCAGGDLDWMRAQFEASRSERVAEARRLAGMLRALNTLEKPVIGRIQGAAYGGGVGMAAVCDVAIAARTARFGLTETRLGLIPATISPYVMARIGEAGARRTFLSARIFDAEEARELGLVARVVAPEELDAAVEREVAPYLAASPAAIAAAKRLVRSLGPHIDESVIEETVARLAAAWESPDAQAGIAAFLEKRKPPWAG